MHDQEQPHVSWPIERQVRLLDVQRTHIELYGRSLDEQGRARSPIGRLPTLAGFYRYCEEEQILGRSPAARCAACFGPLSRCDVDRARYRSSRAEAAARRSPSMAALTPARADLWPAGVG